MKKISVLCGFALAACGALVAATDQINLFDSGVLANSVKVDDVESIKYFKGEGSDTYSHFCVKFLDGASANFAIDDYTAIKYEQADMVNPLNVEVIPHHYGVELDVTTSDPNAWYRFSGVPVDMLTGLDPEDWAMALFEMDAAYIQEVADYYGKPLGAFKMGDIFDQGNERREWFPQMTISDDTPMALCYYTATIENDEVVLTSNPRLLRFSTKKLEDLGIEFDIQAELSSTKIKLTVTPKEHENLTDDFTYYVNLYSAYDVATSDLGTLISTDLYRIQQAVYLYGGKWEDYLDCGTSEHLYTNKRTGDKWIAVACGVEMGVGVTKVTAVEFTVPEAEVIDDCTFDVAVSEISKSEFTLTVTPSNADTRWVGFLVDNSTLSPEKPASQHLANRIYYLNAAHTLDWTDSEYVHSGVAEINTQTGLIDGNLLKAGVEYTALIFGVAEDGARTTEICEVPLKCEEGVTKDLTFEISFYDFVPSPTYRTLTARIKPSDRKQKFVYDYLPATHAAVQDDLSDDEWISGYIDVQGTYLSNSLFSGNTTKVMAFGPTYDYDAGDYVWKKYRAFMFGYDGAPTSELYVFEIDTETGEVTQIRGPQILEDDNE